MSLTPPPPPPPPPHSQTGHHHHHHTKASSSPSKHTNDDQQTHSLITPPLSPHHAPDPASLREILADITYQTLNHPPPPQPLQGLRRQPTHHIHLVRSHLHHQPGPITRSRSMVHLPLTPITASSRAQTPSINDENIDRSTTFTPSTQSRAQTPSINDENIDHSSTFTPSTRSRAQTPSINDENIDHRITFTPSTRSFTSLLNAATTPSVHHHPSLIGLPLSTFQNHRSDSAAPHMLTLSPNHRQLRSHRRLTSSSSSTSTTTADELPTSIPTSTALTPVRLRRLRRLRDDDQLSTSSAPSSPSHPNHINRHDKRRKRNSTGLGRL